MLLCRRTLKRAEVWGPSQDRRLGVGAGSKHMHFSRTALGARRVVLHLTRHSAPSSSHYGTHMILHEPRRPFRLSWRAEEMGKGPVTKYLAAAIFVDFPFGEPLE